MYVIDTKWRQSVPKELLKGSAHKDQRKNMRMIRPIPLCLIFFLPL